MIHFGGEYAAARRTAASLLGHAERLARRGQPRLLAEIFTFLQPQKRTYIHHHAVSHQLTIADALTVLPQKRGPNESATDANIGGTTKPS